MLLESYHTKAVRCFGLLGHDDTKGIAAGGAPCSFSPLDGSPFGGLLLGATFVLLCGGSHSSLPMSRSTDEVVLYDEYGEVISIHDPRHPDFDPTDDQMMEANHLCPPWHDGL